MYSLADLTLTDSSHRPPDSVRKVETPVKWTSSVSFALQQPNSLFTSGILCADLVQSRIIEAQRKRRNDHTSTTRSANRITSGVSCLLFAVPPDPLRDERSNACEAVVDGRSDEHRCDTRHVASHPSR